jgi:hypothetical protein
MEDPCQIAENDPYQIAEEKLNALCDEMERRIEEAGVELLIAPPNWRRKRKKRVKISFIRRQIAELRAGRVPLPPGVSAKLRADRIEKNVNDAEFLMALQRELFEREDAIYAELEASLAAKMPEALDLLRQVQRLPPVPGSPARQIARRMEHALQDAKGKKRKRGKKR